MSVVDIKDVAKAFGDVQAVDGVSLQIVAGEFLVILGPSGCGKTTLMRLIAGLEQPSRGEIWIGNRMVNGLPPRMRQIAMVFQSYALYPHMNVYHNIGFPLTAKRQNLNKHQRDEMIRRAADMVSIGHLLDRRPRQLSGGERQRVAIARALVTEPMVLLLDEPLSNLDAKLRAAARDELKDFQRRLGITTIFVTHDQVEAMGLGDRIVVMSEGKVQQIGLPQSIYDDPDNIFVATFLGSPGMNLLPDNNHLLGFRPEHFLPANRTNDENGRLNLVYHVKRVEFLGSDRLLYGYVDGFPEIRLTLAKLPISVDDPIEVGNSYDFAVQKPALKYFDRQNGLRLMGASNG